MEGKKEDNYYGKKRTKLRERENRHIGGRWQKRAVTGGKWGEKIPRRQTHKCVSSAKRVERTPYQLTKEKKEG